MAGGWVGDWGGWANQKTSGERTFKSGTYTLPFFWGWPMSLGMQLRTVQIVADINTIVYVFIRSWRQDPSVGSFEQHGKWIFISEFIFEYLLSSSTPRSQPWKTRCFNEQVIAILVFIYSATKHALCYLCLFWRQWNAYCRASGSSTHFSSALVRLVLFSALAQYRRNFHQNWNTRRKIYNETWTT